MSQGFPMEQPVIWFLAILPLLGWWFYGLFDIDEGFYGAVVAEMNRRGEWITPFYNGKPWFLPFAGAYYKVLDWIS